MIWSSALLILGLNSRFLPGYSQSHCMWRHRANAWWFSGWSYDERAYSLGSLCACVGIPEGFLLFIGFCHSKASHCSCSLVIGIRSKLSIPVSLYDEEVFPGNFSWRCFRAVRKTLFTRSASSADVGAYICTIVMFWRFVEIPIVMILLLETAWCAADGWLDSGMNRNQIWIW